MEQRRRPTSICTITAERDVVRAGPTLLPMADDFWQNSLWSSAPHDRHEPTHSGCGGAK